MIRNFTNKNKIKKMRTQHNVPDFIQLIFLRDKKIRILGLNGFFLCTRNEENI